MLRYRTAPLLTALMLGTLLVCAGAQQMMLAPPPPLPAGTSAPAFTARTARGRSLSLKSLRGKVVLLDFWATWCGPCQMATPTLQSLHRQFRHRGFTVVGMDMDDPSTVPAVKPFIKHFGMTYPVVVSPATIQRTATAYRVNGIPSQYLIDQRGTIVWSQAGYSPTEGPELAAKIRRLLAKKG